MKKVCFLLAVVSSLAVASRSTATSRFEALSRAKTYASHPWRCEKENLTAGCAAGYSSAYLDGDYVGLPYDWGGYVTIHEFDKGIEDGLGAGSYSDDGVLACTVGLDCSGFVSRVWNTGHYSTSTLGNVSHDINAFEVKPADAFNIPGYHVRLFEAQQANGDPRFIEAAGYNVHVTFWDSWASVNEYTPIRFDDITDDAPTWADGTADNPVVVDSFPFVQDRDTSKSASDMFDVCLKAAPGKGEYGPEVVYRLDLDAPGTVTVAVQDDADTDVDVHLYSALNESDCFARDDKVVSAAVDCGTLYVVADSYTSAGTGVDHPGPYTITIDFTPSGQACGSGPPPYAPGGHPGDPCGFPSAPSLPFCNPNLGGVVCLYTSGANPTSFCTYPCSSDSQCEGDFPGGCCSYVDKDIGDACMPAGFCQSPPPDDAVSDGASSETSSDAFVFDQGQPFTPESSEDVAVNDQSAAQPDTAPEAGAELPVASDTASPAPDDGPGSGSSCSASPAGGSPLGLLLAASLLLLAVRWRVRA